MPSISFRLHFHPVPDRSSPSGTFISRSEFDAYRDFECKQTSKELQAFWYAPPSKRSEAAKALESKRKQTYKLWKQLYNHYLPNGETVA